MSSSCVLVFVKRVCVTVCMSHCGVCLMYMIEYGLLYGIF